MYRAIVEAVENDGYSLKIRIPLLDRVPSSSSNNDSLRTATICTLPGCKPIYRKDDIVFVEMEENDMSKPVVLGILYRQGQGGSAIDITCQSLKVDVDATLSEDTRIGDVGKKNIKALQYVEKNVQSQIDTKGSSNIGKDSEGIYVNI